MSLCFLSDREIPSSASRCLLPCYDVAGRASAKAKKRGRVSQSGMVSLQDGANQIAL